MKKGILLVLLVSIITITGCSQKDSICPNGSSQTTSRNTIECIDSAGNTIKTILYNGNGTIKATTEKAEDNKHFIEILYYENGQIHLQQYTLDGTPDGRFTLYYENGNPSMEGTHENGYLQGEVKQYYENGNLQMIINYGTGLRNGDVIVFLEDGTKRTEAFYEDGIEQGRIITYYENGNVESEGELQDGAQVGDWIFYNEDGSTNETINYDGENWHAYNYGTKMSNIIGSCYQFLNNPRTNGALSEDNGEALSIDEINYAINVCEKAIGKVQELGSYKGDSEFYDAALNFLTANTDYTKDTKWFVDMLLEMIDKSNEGAVQMDETKNAYRIEDLRSLDEYKEKEQELSELKNKLDEVILIIDEARISFYEKYVDVE